MSNLWLIGAGALAGEYVKVLNALELDYKIIGRGDKSAELFEKTHKQKVYPGGLTKFIEKNKQAPDYAIIATTTSSLYDNTIELLRLGVKNILVEKPGALYSEQLKKIEDLSKEKLANVFIAYNRRLYASVIEAKKIIDADGGVDSFYFDFTEWSHRVKEIDKSRQELERWFLCNSTHVVDLAFYLCGKPKELNAISKADDDWEYSNSIFSGAGITDRDAAFSYYANWVSAGRWGVYINTPKRKLIFEPLEELKSQLRGSISVEPINLPSDIDMKFKPGLYLQVSNFVSNNFVDLCSIGEQCSNIEYYSQIAGTKL